MLLNSSTLFVVVVISVKSSHFACSTLLRQRCEAMRCDARRRMGCIIVSR